VGVAAPCFYFGKVIADHLCINVHNQELKWHCAECDFKEREKPKKPVDTSIKIER
jgi:hypothetical protein